MRDLVEASDRRWREAGVTYRQIYHWTSDGYLHAHGETNPGTGYSRRWEAGEVTVAARMVRLRGAGLTLPAAALVARMDGPVDLAPGITLTITEVPDDDR